MSLVADLCLESRTQGSEDRIAASLGRQLQGHGAHLGPVAISDHLAPQGLGHGVESPAGGEGRLRGLVQPAHGFQGRREPWTSLRHRVVSASAQENDVGLVQLTLRRHPTQQVQNANVIAGAPERAGEALDFVLPHGVVGVSHLEQQEAEVFVHAVPCWPVTQAPKRGTQIRQKIRMMLIPVKTARLTHPNQRSKRFG